MKINIPLSEQVVSREVAVQLNEALKKAGIEVEGNYWWTRSKHLVSHVTKEYRWGNWVLINHKVCKMWTETIPTYTLPELLAVLPKCLDNMNSFGQYGHLKIEFIGVQC
jgi:hypothetical protein